MTCCITQSFSSDCLPHGTLYTRVNVWAISFTFNITHSIFDSFGFGFSQWNFRGTNPVWSFAARDRYFGDNGIGSWDWTHSYRIQFISRIGSCNICAFIAYLWCRNWLGVVKSCLKKSKPPFWQDSSEDLDIFTRLSVAHKQTGDCNCFPNCLFEQWLTQLVLGLCL